jgi:CheY-like chemotaxis protein
LADEPDSQQQGLSADFNRTAIALARNPLGIIALFIVLVYAFAAISISVPNDIDGYDLTIIVAFLATFPFVVLWAFVHLVAKYPKNLFGPGDFKDPKDYIAMMEQAATLAAATASAPVIAGEAAPSTETIAQESVSTVRRVALQSWTRDKQQAKSVLWVDDHPENNANLQRTFEKFNIRVTSAVSTEQALRLAGSSGFDAIISDLGRGAETEAGFALLEELNKRGSRTPFFIYTVREDPQLRERAQQLGARALTRSATKLLEGVSAALAS